MRILFLLVSLFAAALAPAATFCVGPSASGNGSGSDWNNKLAWSASFTRGNTYYLEDGNYATKNLNTGTSGTQTITVKKAIASDHGTSTGWVSTMGDGVAVIANTLQINSNYWIIDGNGSGGIGGVRTNCGIRIDNNTSPSNPSQGILALGTTNPGTASNCTIRWVEVYGTAYKSYSAALYSDEGIVTPANVSEGSQTSNTTVEYCWIHDTGGSSFAFRYSNNMTVQYCVYERNHSSNSAHGEGMVLSHVEGLTFRYNLGSDIEGTAFIGTPSGSRNALSDFRCYGNIFMHPSAPTRGGVGTGVIAFFDIDVTGVCDIYNNTFINMRDAVSWPSGVTYNYTNPNITVGAGYLSVIPTLNVRNNMWVSCDSVSDPRNDIDSDIGTLNWNYNAWYATTHWSTTNEQTLSSNLLTNWPAGNFTLTGATTAGFSLSSPYNTDPLGTTRGADGTWDRGAYEYGIGGGGDTTDPVVTITAPTSSPTLATSTTPLTTLAGTSSDNIAVSNVTWVNDRGGSGTATGTTTWSIASVTLQSGANVITVTATDSSGNTATDAITVTYTPPDVTAPAVSITSPTSSPTYDNGAAATIAIGGTASDNIAVANVTWSNDRGGSGTATGTTTWSVASITLQSGTNVITVTATDSSANTAQDTITVTHTPSQELILDGAMQLNSISVFP